MFSRSNLIIVISIFALAMVLRMIFLAGVHEDPPLLYGDAVNYDGSAIGIIEMCRNAWPNLEFIIKEAKAGTLGKGANVLHRLGIHFSIVVFTQGPVYPFFIAIVYAIFGHNLHMVQYAQVLVSSLSCILIFLAAQKAFGDRKVSILASLLWCVYLPGIYYTEQIITETLSAAIMIIAVISLVRITKDSKLRDFFIAGIAIAVLMLTRHSFRFLWALMPLAFLFSFKGIEKKRLYKGIALFLCGVGVLLIPWMSIVTFASGKAMGLPANKDYWRELYINNDIKNDGWPPDSTIGKPKDEGPSPYKKLFFDNLIKYPAGTILLYLEKVRRVWDRFLNFRNRFFLVPDSLFLVVHRAIVCLGLFGIFLAVMRKRNMALLAAILVYVSALSSVILVEARYNFVTMPIVIMFAGFFVFNFLKVPRKDLAYACIAPVIILAFFGGVGAMENRNASEWHHKVFGDQSINKTILLPDEAKNISGVKEVNLLVDMTRTPWTDVKIECNGRPFLYSGMTKRDRFTHSLYDDIFKMRSLEQGYVRQWHALAIPADLLLSGVIEVKMTSVSHAKIIGEFTIFGDRRDPAEKLYRGPSFARSADDTAIYKFGYDSDYRLPREEELYNTGIKSDAKNGEYRIRLEVIKGDGSVKTY